MKHTLLAYLFLQIVSTSAMAVDFTTPEGALKALEDAYVRKDLNGAVAAKDFYFEAKAMLKALKNLPNPDDALIKQTAEVHELAFRKQMQTKGFPDFKGVRCTVTTKKYFQPDLVEMIEECNSPTEGNPMMQYMQQEVAMAGVSSFFPPIGPTLQSTRPAPTRKSEALLPAAQRRR